MNVAVQGEAIVEDREHKRRTSVENWLGIHRSRNVTADVISVELGKGPWRSREEPDESGIGSIEKASKDCLLLC